MGRSISWKLSHIHGESAGAKIMKQSKQISLLNKLQLQTTKKERRPRFFSGFNTQNWHWFTCTRCISVFQQAQMLR